MTGCAFQFQRRFFEFRLILPLAVAVRLVTDDCTVVIVDAHLTVAVRRMGKRTPGFVDGNQMVIHSQTIPLGVTVCKQASLQHFVRRKADSRYDIGGIEGGLLNIDKIVFWISVQLQNADVDQVFVFMHKPLWTMTGPAAAEWQRIASWLPQNKTTIFAGHHHRLLYEQRNGHRYIILAATGAGMSPMAVDELGRYHHFSLVTVEPDTAIVAIVKPGQILAETVATREFSEALDRIVSYQAFLEPDLSKSEPAASVGFDLHNPFDEPLELRFEVQSEDTSGWEFQPMRMSLVLPKGSHSEQVFSGKYTQGSRVPLPVVRYTAVYKGETILSVTKSLLPGRASDRRSPQQVHVVGPFDLGIRKRPPAQGEARALVPRWFEKLGPETNLSLAKSYKTYKGKKRWQKVRIENGFIDLDNLLGDQDFAIAYVQFTIRSPENQTVFAGVRPDNICRVFANGKMVVSGEPLREVANQPRVFLLPLRKGENTILLKLAEYTGSWYTEFWVADPRGTLAFE